MGLLTCKQFCEFNPGTPHAQHQKQSTVIHDIVEAHCYLVDIGDLIVSKYVAESITVIHFC